jgi:hypothetical protein
VGARPNHFFRDLLLAANVTFSIDIDIDIDIDNDAS